MRKIVIMERVAMPSDFNFRVAFRLDVPPARQPFYANAAATSAVVGAPADELAAIKAGEVIEVVEIVPRPAGTPALQLRGRLVNRHGELQADLTARNPYQFYGTSWDGVAWSNVTVA